MVSSQEDIWNLPNLKIQQFFVVELYTEKRNSIGIILNVQSEIEF